MANPQSSLNPGLVFPFQVGKFGVFEVVVEKHNSLEMNKYEHSSLLPSNFEPMEQKLLNLKWIFRIVFRLEDETCHPLNLLWVENCFTEVTDTKENDVMIHIQCNDLYTFSSSSLF